jgi:hypothetical protein
MKQKGEPMLKMTIHDAAGQRRVAAGQIGRPPVPPGQDFQYTLSTLGRLVEAEQFGDIILRTGADGEVTYLKDVSQPLARGCYEFLQKSRRRADLRTGLTFTLTATLTALNPLWKLICVKVHNTL